MKCNVLLALLAAMLVFPAVNADAARKTRDLVFEEEETAAAAEKAQIPDSQVVAVKTTLKLKRDGEVSTVTPAYQFKSGDSVKIHYSTNIDGYVYWLAKGSSGSYNVLFPSPGAGMDNAVKKNVEYTIPAKGSFRFDATPGKEELLCVLSPQRLPDLDKAVADASGSRVSPDSATQVAAVENRNASRRKTRDLVFEEEEDETVNTKTQVAPKGEPFVAYYELIHK